MHILRRKSIDIFFASEKSPLEYECPVRLEHMFHSTERVLNYKFKKSTEYNAFNTFFMSFLKSVLFFEQKMHTSFT